MKTVTNKPFRARPAAPVGARLPRCRILTRRQDRCPNVAVTDLGICAHHLAEAAAEYTAIVAEAAANAPALAGAR